MQNQYWLTRFLILRLLGFIYFIAFLILINQAVPLIGENGLLPADAFLTLLQKHFASRGRGFVEYPSLFWFHLSDASLLVFAWIGLFLSLIVFSGFANSILMLLLWGLYLSYVSIGQLWYSYGWEIQLLETGFLAVFLCPLLDPRPFPRRAPPVAVIWLFRWLGFRIMLGAGLIKLRGDPCWRDLTCLYYHYETQPLPNPLSRTFHFMPKWFHQVGVLWNHFTELLLPWFAVTPRILRNIAGVLLIAFQVFLIISGNLSFLNYLTIVPMIAYCDDGFLRRLLPSRIVQMAENASTNAQPSRSMRIASLSLAGIVAVLSIPIVTNLLSSRQIMNTSFESLHLVNTYGAFGSVGKQRDEIIFEGTQDTVITEKTEWRAYEFKCKPGDPNRRPCVIAPYQYRIDWQIWFAAMATPNEYPWTLHFVWKLLHNDVGTLSLIANNPFPNAPPHFVRAQLYRYEFAPAGGLAWWNRKLIGDWLPALSVDHPGFREALKYMGWLKQ
jgi:Lipase maturation factor